MFFSPTETCDLQHVTNFGLGNNHSFIYLSFVKYVFVSPGWKGNLLRDAAGVQRGYRRGHWLACGRTEGSQVLLYLGFLNQPINNIRFRLNFFQYLYLSANCFFIRASFPRYGYFGRVMPEVVRLMFCRVSGCLTEGRIFVSASGEEMVSINTRDTTGIRILQDEGVEVRNRNDSIEVVKWPHRGYFRVAPARWCCWPPQRTQSSRRWLTSCRRGWAARWCRWEKSPWMSCFRWWRRGSCSGRTWHTWVNLSLL